MSLAYKDDSQVTVGGTQYFGRIETADLVAGRGTGNVLDVRGLFKGRNFVQTGSGHIAPAGTNVNITFPFAFNTTPAVLITPTGSVGGALINVSGSQTVTGSSTTGFSVTIPTIYGSGLGFTWLAINMQGA